uniref:Uncharacterized protein n=1 Tax=Helianthus annuus TaxID=4232 RepID=A0A251V4V4_HELAN
MAATDAQCAMGVAPSLPAAPTVYGGGGFRRCEWLLPRRCRWLQPSMAAADGYDDVVSLI